ncbi:MAG: Verru_Chthon cassette protein C [Chthoniobacterales bacterium]|nr:Verru_Chthon cassette protein C [Chthoniobacterales bacterium]
MLPSSPRITAFTLIEVLVACAVLALTLVIVFMIVSQTSSLWKNTTSKSSAFQNARAAFEAVTRNLSQATLNHYLDYYDTAWKHTTAGSASAPPAHYGRFSELEFVSGPVTDLFPSAGGKVSHAVFFQAPLGKTSRTDLAMESPGMLNAAGYFVAFGPRSQYEQIPKFLQGEAESDRLGFRLIEWVQPTESLSIYDKTHLGSQPWKWFRDPIGNGQSCRVMAENVIALIILPKDADNVPLASYAYDSLTSGYDESRTHLLPPLLQVTLVAIDEVSAQRLREANGASQPALIPSDAFQNIATYDQDLADLENVLNGKNGRPRLTYRIFTTTVATKENP